MKPIGHEEVQAKRIAARLGFHFHIDQYNYLTEHCGYDSNTRPATDSELQMWNALVPAGWLAGETLDATPDELAGVLAYYSGIVYLNAMDLAVLRLLEQFKPCTSREDLRDGHVGMFLAESFVDGKFIPKPISIYVSRVIPKGYVLKLESKLEILHWQPSPGSRQIRPEIPHEILTKIDFGLSPIMCSYNIQAVLAKSPRAVG